MVNRSIVSQSYRAQHGRRVTPVCQRMAACVSVCVGLAFGAGQHAAAQNCQWDPTFQSPGFNGSVWNTVMHDDGTGVALYATGNFGAAGGVKARQVAKWTGTRWEPLAGGLSAGSIWPIHLASFDPDGPGPSPALLIAGGAIVNAYNPNGITINHSNRSMIVAWNGSTWEAIGDLTGRRPGQSSSVASVTDLAVFDFGQGPRLVAAGNFANIDAATFCNGLAVWDGSSWSALGTGIEGPICGSLSVFDDGTGPALYVGGEFYAVNGTLVSNIAKLTNGGQDAVALGDGIPGRVLSMTGLDVDGPGGQAPVLYVSSLWQLDRWESGVWSTVPNTQDHGAAHALTTFNAGNGPEVFAAGALFGLNEAGIATIDSHTNVARVTPMGYDYSFGGRLINPLSLYWIDHGWGLPDDSGRSIAVHDLDGPGPMAPTLVASGGMLCTDAGRRVDHLAVLRAGAWEPLNPDARGVSQGAVQSLVYGDPDADGPIPPGVVVSGPLSIGSHMSVQEQRYGLIADALHQGVYLGSVVPPRVIFFDLDADGTAPTTLCGLGVSSLLFYENGAWGDGGLPELPEGTKTDICWFDPDGAGPDPEMIHICGVFSTTNALGIKRLRDGVWEDLPALTTSSSSDSANVLCVHDDGTGKALYVGGNFRTTGSVVTDSLIKFKDGVWSAAGTGTGVRLGSNAGTVRSMVSVDPDQGGPLPTSLVFTGDFNTLDGAASSCVGARTLSGLVPLGDALSKFPTGVRAIGNQLRVKADSLGDSLYLCGSFSVTNNPDVSNIAKLVGGVWTGVAPAGVEPFAGGAADVLFISQGNSERTIIAGSADMPAIGFASSGLVVLECTYCTGDFNRSGDATVQDIFDFLSAWFSGAGAADVNQSGSVTVQDIFDFLSAWFQGC